MRRLRTSLLAAAAGLLLAACGSAVDHSGPPNWQPSPALGAGDDPGGQASPIVPVPSPPGGAPAPAPRSGGPTRPSPSSTDKVDPFVVATDLTAPVGLTLLPDGTALVGERTTGRIVRVQPQAGQPVPTVRTLTGLDTAGDGGLLDLALSPTFDEDGLIYAYITTPSDNRVVDFTLKGPVTPVLVGIPRGRTGNTGRLMFGVDGDLYVGTGDAGHPPLAADPRSLAGKVLRVDDIGDPADGNPSATSPVLTSGHHVVDGLCAIPRTTSMLEVEPGSTATDDEVNLLSPGAAYGWPSPTGGRPPVTVLPVTDRAPGGCAVLGRRLWVTSLNGQALLSAPIAGSGATVSVGKFAPVLVKKYGRLRTVVAADDGALWLTTSNRDGAGKPVPTDERVIRYLPASPSGGNAPV